VAEKARLLLAAAIVALLAAGAVHAQAQPQPKPKPKPPPAQASTKAPSWTDLSAEHQQILAPLKNDWEQITPDRRRNWIGIAKRYPTMKPEAQQRVQRRMQAWAKLTPEQRKQARENYRRISKVPPDKRGDLKQQWSDYQSLPPQERQGTPLPKKKPAPAK
jgi:Spy/CpxP family protein refolding chaperone